MLIFILPSICMMYKIGRHALETSHKMIHLNEMDDHADHLSIGSGTFYYSVEFDLTNRLQDRYRYQDRL